MTPRGYGALVAPADAAGAKGLEWSFACPAWGMVLASSVRVSAELERVPDPLVLAALGGVANTDCAEGTDASDEDGAARAGSTPAVST